MPALPWCTRGARSRQAGHERVMPRANQHRSHLDGSAGIACGVLGEASRAPRPEPPHQVLWQLFQTQATPG
eukprot:2392882-Alexandrium_andersonii.AAC.1